jgi:hypothetical protein
MCGQDSTEFANDGVREASSLDAIILKTTDGTSKTTNIKFVSSRNITALRPLHTMWK